MLQVLFWIAILIGLFLLLTNSTGAGNVASSIGKVLTGETNALQGAGA